MHINVKKDEGWGRKKLPQVKTHGKGSNKRPYDADAFASNWDEIDWSPKSKKASPVTPSTEDCK